MGEPVPSRLDRESWQVLNRKVGQFETAWRESGQPLLRDYLPDADPALRCRILVELIKVDQEITWQSGGRCGLESYLDEWPELGRDPDVVAELLEAECLTRCSVATSPSRDELDARFPEIAPRIDLQAITARAAADSESLRIGRAGGRQAQDSDSAVADAHNLRLVPGSRFDRYEIREQLGQGSMGAVYRAWDTRLRREVALKIPHTGLAADQEFVERFRSEAVAMAQVHHPAVCPVFDAFEVDGTLALTMACLEGENLGKWMTGRLNQQQIAELMLETARGVDAIHERGVVHRDLKPSNVIINRRGQPVLTDFGLALSPQAAHSTADGESLSGTPAYMSPEQIEGRAEVDHRSDVYSLGVLLFQMLTGSLPFSGDLESVLNDVRTREPSKPSSLRPGINRTLELICLKSLEKAPADRFQTAEELAIALERCLSSMKQRTRRIRRRAVAGLGTVFAAALVVLVLFLLRKAPESDENIMLLARPRREFSVPGAPTSGRALIVTPDSQFLVASSQDDFPAFRFFDPETDRDGAGIDFSIPDQFYNDEDGFRAPRHTHYGADLSADGRYLYCTDYYATCIVRLDLESGNPPNTDFLPISHRWTHGVAVTPDGRRLVTASGMDNRPTDHGNDRIVIVDIEDGRFALLNEIALPDERCGRTIGFSDDSRSAYVITRPRRSPWPVLYEISLNEPFGISRRLSFPESELADLAVASDSDRIFVSDAVRRTVRVIDRKTLTDTGLEFMLYGNVPGVLVLDEAAGRLFVLCTKARKLICLDPESGEIQGGAHGLLTGAEQLHLSDSGDRIWTVQTEGRLCELETDDLLNRIVFSSNRAGTHQIHAISPDAQSVLRITDGPHTELFPRWSPDGKRIAFLSNRSGQFHVCIMNRAGDDMKVFEQTDPFSYHEGGIPLDWSPDGGRIAFLGADRKAVRSLNPADGIVETLLERPIIFSDDRVYDLFEGLSWCSADRLLLAGVQEGYGPNADILALDPQSGEVSALTDQWGSPQHFMDPAGVADSNRVAVSHIVPPGWRVGILQNGRVVSVTDSSTEMTRTPCWFSDGRRLLYSRGGGRGHRLFLAPADGGPSIPLTPPGHDSRHPHAWSAR